MADGRIIIDTKVDSSGAEKDAKGLSSKIGNVAGKALGGVTKVTAAMVTAAAGAVTVLTKLSIEQYAQYEQLVGGVETLFKDSSKQVLEYANNAYKTAGMSANEYMSTITGFSASLLQGLGGDTKKAAEIGNKAVTDMSDNANKMGTSMEMIQNAYQGFAKQNYTMLDNLKLGYGGTKTEMQRLLADAEKLTGIKYNIDNFSDVIEAIHVIQNEMGITGTTAKEASETIEGSLNMTKSAWTNLMTGLADDNANFDVLIDNFIESAGALASNLLPRIKIAINGVTKLFESLAGKLPSIISSILPDLISSGVNVVKNLIGGIQSSLPSLVKTALDMAMSLIDGIIDVLPMLLETGYQAILTLGQGIADSLPELIPTIVDLMISLCDMIIENLPLILDVAIDIILALVQGLINALPTLIAEVPRIINEFSNAIYGALPKILKAGIDIILMLIKGLIDSIPTLVANIPQIIMAIINVFTLVNWANIGKNLITNIGEGIKNAGSGLLGKVKSIAGEVISSLKSFFGWDNMSSIGQNLIKGIWNGISNMKGWILNLIGGFADNVISSIKDFFGIHSPSRIMRDLIGTNIVKGIGVGIDLETPNLEKDIDSNMLDLVAKMRGTVDYETAQTTARVVAENNRSLGNSQDDVETKDTDNNGNVVALFDIDGRRFMRAIAQYQDEFEIYNERRLT